MPVLELNFLHEVVDGTSTGIGFEERVLADPKEKRGLSHARHAHKYHLVLGDHYWVLLTGVPDGLLVSISHPLQRHFTLPDRSAAAGSSGA